ncbi:leucine-rich repeat-containing protein 38 isoform X2 [Paramormyrops kingsleyae]|uniref:leucine-rich repeat-containing protein 38 isoform X2 n=1 Tax=Paramormyrops kingsleyae TaxID=1676925 RepID=UPI000CD6317A|nr:leucine-rich repeat-containing protein 38-like isoform X2 [Paramormyrops kingsleyae]
MLLCVRWIQPLLALLSSALLTWGAICPPSCLCPDPHTVDCSGRGLTRLPEPLPLDVRRLLLSNNWIPKIPSDFLVLYSDLVYLDLRNNSITQIEAGTISPSSRLVFLDLGSNNLTEIPTGTFGESRSLIKLRLGSNPYLSMVSEDAFLGLTSLRELELERNALSSLQVGALSQLPSLKVVRLEGNPWVCDCDFSELFAWLVENRDKLPNGSAPRLSENSSLCILLQNIPRLHGPHMPWVSGTCHRHHSPFSSQFGQILMPYVHQLSLVL